MTILVLWTYEEHAELKKWARIEGVQDLNARIHRPEEGRLTKKTGSITSEENGAKPSKTFNDLKIG